jgi:hypothetical protein
MTYGHITTTTTTTTTTATHDWLQTNGNVIKLRTSENCIQWTEPKIKLLLIVSMPVDLGLDEKNSLSILF